MKNLFYKYNELSDHSIDPMIYEIDSFLKNRIIESSRTIVCLVVVHSDSGCEIYGRYLVVYENLLVRQPVEQFSEVVASIV